MQTNNLDRKIRSLGEEAFPDPSERIVWLDYLKAISAIAVVVTHIASIGWQAMSPFDDGWLATSVYEIVTRFAVPAFFMSSGALLLNPRRELKTRRILIGYIPKTAVIALVVSFAYCLLERALCGWQGWRTVVIGALDGPYFIWYLWVLIGLYALTPLLRVISSRESCLGYAVVLLAVFVMARSTADAMAPDGPLTLLLDNFIIFSPGMEGVFYYLLGAWLISHPIYGRRGLAVIAVGTVSLALAVYLNYQDALANGPDLYFVARDNLLIALFSVGVWEACLLFFSAARGGRVLHYVVRGGLFIYLFHPFLRLCMESMKIFQPLVDWLFAAPLVSIPIISGVIWALSAAAASVIGLIASLTSKLGWALKRPVF